MTGAGTITAATLGGEATGVSNAGPGTVAVPVVETRELKVIITVSGSANLAALKAERAKVDVAGSRKLICYP